MSAGMLLAAVLALVVLGTGCASTQRQADCDRQVSALRARLLQLGPNVDEQEAASLARAAVDGSSALARDYRAVRPAWFHNVLVNHGLRSRGLCFQWANDLFARLGKLDPRTLDLYLVVAHMDTRREHNAIVVTAHRDSFDQGVVLDAWRHSGRLWFGDVDTDKYPWQLLPHDRVQPELLGCVRQ